jgi:hypothetical protein
LSKRASQWSRKEWAEFWEERDREFLALPAEREKAARLFEVLVKYTHGPDLDYSVDSLLKFGHWYVDLALEDFRADQIMDQFDWPEPHVQHPELESHYRWPHREWSRTLDAIYHGLGYYADKVELRLIPEARYVCWRGAFTDDMRSGNSYLDVGDPLHPLSARNCVFTVVSRTTYEWFFNPAVPNFFEPIPEAVFNTVNRQLAERREWLERNGSPVWQVAPTGPAAFEGRNPFRRATMRWRDAWKRGEVGVPKVYRGPAPPPEDPNPGIGMG